MCDFAALQSSKCWKRFIFSSENQPGGNRSPVSLCMTFDTLRVVQMDAPGLYFTAGERAAGQGYHPLSMSLSGVISIDYGEPSVLGDVLLINCKRGGKSAAYTIIAS